MPAHNEKPVIGAPISPLVPLNPDGSRIRNFDEILCNSIDADGSDSSRSMLRNYDFGLREWFQGVTAFDGKFMPVFKETPLRAFSTYKQLLTNGKVTPVLVPDDAETETAKMPLPFACFHRGDLVPRVSEQSQNWTMRNLQFIGEKKRRTAYTRYPKPVTIPYQVDYYCRYENHANWFDQKILEQFDGQISYWTVRTPLLPDRYFLMAMHFKGLANNTEVETDKDKLIRKTLSVDVDGWMFFDIFKAPTFEIAVESITMAPDTTPDYVETTKLTDLAGMSTAETEALPSVAAVSSQTSAYNPGPIGYDDFEGYASGPITHLAGTGYGGVRLTQAHIGNMTILGYDNFESYAPGPITNLGGGGSIGGGAIVSAHIGSFA